MNVAAAKPPSQPAQTVNHTFVVGTRNRRETAPTNFNPYNLGIMGMIPRRGVADPLMFGKMFGPDPERANRYLQQFTTTRLLSYLPEIDPLLGLAVWNALRLSCNGDEFRIAVTKSAAQGQDVSGTDDAATAEVDALWKSLPNEIGGIDGLRISMTLQAMFTGLVVCEGVPGELLTGLRRVWPVDSMTVYFGRDDVDADLTPYQHQWFPNPDAKFGYVRLDKERVPWRAVDNWPDDAYGRAPFAPAFQEIMADIALMKDLRDAVHHVAWPRLKIGFNFAETYKMAVEIVGIRNPQEAAAWVQARFQEVVEYVRKIKADDDLVSDTNGTSDTIEGGKGFTNLSEILALLRQRIVQACKTLPTLVGINDGSTQTYTSVEWAIYAAGLETIRSIVADVLVKLANLHLQLKGIPLTCKATYTPIRTNDEFLDAQAKGLQIDNAVKMVALGWVSNEDACRSVTGNAPVKAEADPELLKTLAGAPPSPPPGQGVPGKGGSDQNPPKNGNNGTNNKQKPGGGDNSG